MFKTCKKPPMSIITASGDICSFKALQAGIPLKSHVVQLTATQSGSGTPSPSNPRPISGYSAINISHSDADTSNPTVYTIQIGSTVYGGTYDAITGILTVTHGYIEFDGSNDENWRTYSGQRYTVPVSDFTSPSSSQLANIMCDKLETITKAQQGSRTFVISGSDAGTHDFMVNVGANSYEDMITWLNTNPITVVYELATPTTIQLPPCPIDTLEVNNIWADTGNTSLEAFKFGR